MVYDPSVKSPTKDEATARQLQQLDEEKGAAAECSNANELNDDSTVVYSSNCSARGLVVMKRNDESFCWMTKWCKNGHLNGKGMCDTGCECPAWASRCSYPEETQMSSDGDVETILTVGRVKVCSLKPDSSCSTKSEITKLNQIQLFDGTKAYVENLHIHWSQSTGHTFKCIGDGRLTGTVEFCLKRNCYKQGTKFCYYPVNEIAAYVNSAGEVPIKAYGIVSVPVYHYRHQQSQLKPCSSCSVHCIKGGVQLSFGAHINFAEICTPPYCYKISFPKEEETLMFPAAVNMEEHEVFVKTWSQGQLLKSFGTTCSPQPFCEQIECYICLARIKNPQCSSTMALLLIALSVYFLSATLYILLKLTAIIFKILRSVSTCLWVTGKCCWRLSKRARNRTYRSTVLPVYALIARDEDDEVNESEPLVKIQMKDLVKKSSTSTSRGQARMTEYRKKLPYFMSIVVLAASATSTHACTEVATMKAQSAVCMALKNGQQECTLNEVTRLALAPQGQVSCLLIENFNGEPLGTIQLKMKHVSLKCQKKTEYFSRSYRMSQEAVKRCPNTGSCHDSKCKIIFPYTIIPELTDDANLSPGYTHCRETCGGWGCGCFLFENGCTFFRVFAVPISTDIYELFSCPNWQYSVDASLRIDIANETSEKELTLTPGNPRHWNRIEATLTSITSAPSPLLGSQFMTNGKQTVLVSASAPGQALSGTIGSLQCANEATAVEFNNCTISHDSCQCEVQGGNGETVACNCINGKLESVFKQVDNLIPLISRGIALLPDNDSSIRAEFRETTSLEVQLSLHHFKLRSQVDKSSCKFKLVNFTGCYNCLTGAKLHYTCVTDFGETIAHIHCNKEKKFSAVCRETEGISNATIAWKEAEVNTECRVICPGGESSFKLKGTLVNVEYSPVFEVSNIIAGKIVDEGMWNWTGSWWNVGSLFTNLFGTLAGVFENLFNWFWHNLLWGVITVVGLLVAIPAALFITYLLLKKFIIFGAYSFYKKVV